jgi:CheY-like chemotaxis protein
MKPKILVVDDEPDALEVLGFKLKAPIMSSAPLPTRTRSYPP